MLPTALPLLPLLLVSFLFSQAQTSKPLFQKEPGWVTLNAVSYTADKLDAEAMNGVMDLVYEKQISFEANAVYTKRALTFLSEAGVQSNSEISVEFDPVYQHLIFHHINLVRNGRVIDKLEPSNIKTVQQEKDLNSFIYNGTLTAMLFLGDVQKGDVLEYSYTLKGFNPIFGGRYSGVLDVGFSVPVRQIYYKLITPAGRPVSIKNRNANIAPSITRAATGTVYEWRMNGVSALHTDDNLPSWYDPYPTIMVSEFQTWKEVNDWARFLFPFDVPLSKALQAKVQELQRTYSDPESRVQAALRFVQDGIRYLGIEMGENSHKPHQPDLILRQRFGDCKDKSYLLCTLLRALGVEANPVLINTSYKKTVNERLPTPIAFDHTTVRVKLNDKVYWFDPTIAFQRGPLDGISFPDYGSGLVITDSTTQLTDIPLHSKGQVNIREIFNIPDMSGRVRLKVVTDYSGAFADATRSDFKSTSNYELRKTYTDFYTSYFRNIKADSLTASDSENTGVFTTTEYYTIDSVWGPSAYMKEASFEPYVIKSIIKKPDGAIRTMPFSLRYPVHYTEEIQINLPEMWDVKHSDHFSESAAFRLHADYSCTGKQMLLKYEFETLKDHIGPTEVAEYLRQINKAEDGIAYTLTSTVTEETSSSVTSNSNYASLYLLLGLCVFITYTARKRKTSNR